MLYGGDGATPRLGDLWEFDGTDWSQVVTAGIPEARMDTRLVFDRARGVSVMFGGTGLFSIRPLGDTWEWHSKGWVRRNPATVPAARTGQAMAYDSVRGRTLMFGGRDFFTMHTDLWAYDAVDWVFLSAGGQGLRLYPAMAFDEHRDRLVLFSGLTPADTWEFDGTTWTQRNPAASPPGRSYHKMVYDPIRRETVMFGGTVAGRFNDTWLWDGTNWTQATTAVAPPARGNHNLVFDSARGVVVLTGGIGGSLGPLYNDVWEWNGTSWRQRTPVGASLPARTSAMASFDANLRRVVVFGGKNFASSSPRRDMWSLGPIDPASISELGLGCRGSNGSPVLGVAPYQLPWLGDSLELQVTDLVAGTSATVWFGVSSPVWRTFVLPLSLTVFGMPGCVLWAGPDVVVPLSVTGSTGRLVVPIPNQRALLGLQLFVQGAGVDFAANAANLVVSTAIRLEVGAR